METNTTPALIKPDQVLAQINTLPEILAMNSSSVEKAKAAMQTMNDTIEAAGGITTQELDSAVNDLLVKVRKTATTINERRAPITQFLSSITKTFTGLEADLDPKQKYGLPARLQKARVDYAEMQLRKKQEEERRIALKTATRKEEAEMIPRIQSELRFWMSYELDLAKKRCRALFDMMTIENQKEYSNLIQNFETTLKNDLVASALKQVTIPLVFMEKKVFDSMLNNVIEAELPLLIKNYLNELAEFRQSIFFEIPARIQELEQIAAALRANDLKRQQELFDQQETRRIENEKQQDIQKQQEADRIKQQEEQARTVAVATTLFDQQVRMAEVAPQTKFQEVIELVVLQPAGWMPIIALWFEKDGLKEADMEKMGKKTLESMRKFAESHANKTGERITSAGIQYRNAAKVQTRK